MGKRLHPLTLDCPKPMLKIGNKPILEILINNFTKSGFRKFYISINYKGEMIKAYFGNGEKFGVEIKYIEESQALGTAGSLGLLPSKPADPFFVVNADILTNINFDLVMDYHLSNESHANATVCVRQHENTIPFGVVHISDDDCSLEHVEEKPKKTYFVNAGIYVLDPDVLNSLQYNTYCDMPTFLTELVEKKQHVSTFPIREYWLDIGHHDNLMRAASDYVEVFL
jgi:NDP-sugar pyrophosphorylase family protein